MTVFGPANERHVTRASSLRKRRVRWTWRGWLALGYLAVWCGAGEIGKSTFAAWVIRGLTRGELNGEFLDKPQGALIICTEDGREDIWLPRLEAVDADLDRVAFLDYPHGWNVKDGAPLIGTAVKDADVPLVFLDAVMSHMPDPRGGENIRSPTYVRSALEPLADVRQQRRITSLFGLHPRKAGGDTFADVVQESGAFTQLPRIGLLFGYHPDDLELDAEQRRRVILRGKGNIGRSPGALSFRIAEKFLDYGDDDPDGVADGTGYVTDVEPCRVTERQLLRARPPAEKELSKLAVAEAIIGAVLEDGNWHLAVPIKDRLAELDIDASSTLATARSNLGAVSSQQPGVTHGPYYWRIPHSSTSEPSWETLARTREEKTQRKVTPQKPPYPQHTRSVSQLSLSSTNGAPGGVTFPTPPEHACARERREPTCDSPAHRPSDWAFPDGEIWICGICHPHARAGVVYRNDDGREAARKEQDA
jgi:hypothetical protein